MKTQMMPRKAVLMLLIVGTVLLAGCGGGGSSYPSAVQATTPTTPTQTPTNTPQATSPGDFAFRSIGLSDIRILTPNGGVLTGSLPLTLRSVSGFTAPITFPITTAVRDANGAILSNYTVTASVTPATLTLPAGDTTVTLQVTAPQNLPAGATAVVKIRATGGGLNRYPSSLNPYSPDAPNSTEIDFTPAFFNLTNSIQQTISPVVGSTGAVVAGLDHGGVSGTATLTVTGLPNGITATPTTVAVPADTLFSTSVSVPVTVTGTVAPGNYPVQIVATLNGVTYTSPTLNLQVSNTASN